MHWGPPAEQRLPGQWGEARRGEAEPVFGREVP